MKPVVRVFAFLLLAAGLAAQLPSAWQAWRFSAPIAVPAAPGGRLVSVAVPAAVTLRARREWTDLRVIDAQGGEVPFVLLARTGGRAASRFPAKLLEPSGVKGAYRQVVADVGDGAAVHNSVKLRFEAQKNLLSWVEVAVSSDLKDWRVVRDRAPIYVLRESGMGENTEVTYPDSASRYLRVRVLDGSETYLITAVEVGTETVTEAERVSAGLDLRASTDRQGNSVWTSDGDASAWPLSRVEFSAPPALFYRHVTIERSDTGEQWQRVADGDVLRAPDGARERAWLGVDFPETYARRWRVIVLNRSDAAVAGLQPALLTAVRRVVLKAEPGEAYRLLYGNPRGRASRYDMAELTDRRQLEAAESVTLGAGAENAAWVDPSPWTERHDTALWGALVIAVIVLGAVAVRTLRG
jgi:hypothetical protein